MNLECIVTTFLSYNDYMHAPLPTEYLKKTPAELLVGGSESQMADPLRLHDVAAEPILIKTPEICIFEMSSRFFPIPSKVSSFTEYIPMIPQRTLSLFHNRNRHDIDAKNEASCDSSTERRTFKGKRCLVCSPGLSTVWNPEANWVFILDSASSNDVAIDIIPSKLYKNMNERTRKCRRLRYLAHITSLVAKAFLRMNCFWPSTARTRKG